jgi:hypothetical protein
LATIFSTQKCLVFSDGCLDFFTGRLV